ncbi:hypothetical protein FIBSPDRAFT_883815 [Athelia psychrophila]|uniref:Uncharacterized protein n=1 Tax=Athelia psychrophila TaxID=1759441 RepID=A0A166TJB6_9AGAM|nr:hypothetical protein FIBSPDRAFT_883815 [Fibularhizoctonia sp. CBS 109695]
MAPRDKRRWATNTEISWLMERIPEYSEAQKKHRYDKFWPALFQSYFDAFPPPEPTPGDPTDSEADSEPEPESDVPLDSAEEEAFANSAPGKRKQKAVVQKAIKRGQKVQSQSLSREDKITGRFIRKRKVQLKSYLQWHCPPIPRAPRRKKGSATGPLGLPVFGQSAAAHKPHRVNQEDEMYIKLFYPTRIIQNVRERLKQEELTGPAVNLIRKVAREMYEKEDSETQGKVKSALAAQRAENAEESEEEVAVDDTPTPQQYQEAIDTFPPYIDAILQEVTKRTCFSATLIMGGPIPAHNGAISTMSYHMGKNFFGSTFGVANQNYNSDIIRPYTEFLCTIYSRIAAETRAARALNALPSGSALPTECLHPFNLTSTAPAPSQSTKAPNKLSPNTSLAHAVSAPTLYTTIPPTSSSSAATSREQAPNTSLPHAVSAPAPYTTVPSTSSPSAATSREQAPNTSLTHVVSAPTPFITIPPISSPSAATFREQAPNPSLTSVVSAPAPYTTVPLTSSSGAATACKQAPSASPIHAAISPLTLDGAFAHTPPPWCLSTAPIFNNTKTSSPFANPSPHHNHIAQKEPTLSADHETASGVPQPTAARLGYKDSLRERAVAEAPADNPEALATNTNAPAAAEPVAANQGPRPKPRAIKRKKSAAELGAAQPTSPPNLFDPNPPIPSSPVIVSSGADAGLQGRPRRSVHISAAAEQYTIEKEAKAAARVALAAKRVERAAAKATQPEKKTTQPKKKKTQPAAKSKQTPK